MLAWTQPGQIEPAVQMALTLPHKDDARPETWISRCEAHEDAFGTCLLQAGTGDWRLATDGPRCCVAGRDSQFGKKMLPPERWQNAQLGGRHLLPKRE